ncbi:MAG: ArsR/SmtB family transcription factor [Acutalibacteraceae bacterium]
MTKEEKIAKMCKAVSDANRVQILCSLQNGEKCACVLLDDLQVSQPTLSHHMKILCEAGLVTGRKEGKWVHYSICKEGAEEMESALNALLTIHGGTKINDTQCCS